MAENDLFQCADVKVAHDGSGRQSLTLAPRVTLTKCAAKVEKGELEDNVSLSSCHISHPQRRRVRLRSQKEGIRKFSMRDYSNRVPACPRDAGSARLVRRKSSSMLIPHKLSSQGLHGRQLRRASVVKARGAVRRRNALIGNLPQVADRGKRKGLPKVKAPSVGSPKIVGPAKDLETDVNALRGDSSSMNSARPMMIGSPLLVEVHKNTFRNDIFDSNKQATGMGVPQATCKLKQISHYFTAPPPSTRKAAGRRAERTTRDSESFCRKQDWNREEACEWNNRSGQKVQLEEADLLSFSESECVALQKVAEQRLRDIDLGVSITVPKDDSKTRHWKRIRPFQGNKAAQSKKNQDHVFSIPLVRVVENDQLLRLQTVDDDTFSSVATGGNDDESLAHSSAEASPKLTRRISSSQDSSVELSASSVVSTEGTDPGLPRTSSPSTPPNDSPMNRRKAPGGRTLRRRGAVGLDTDTEIDPDQKKVLESLVSSTRDKKRSLLPPTMPQVPYVVQKCCAHILKHGLDVTGIFRLAGSKKRVKQLREEFDHGVDVKIDEDYHANDVAALLKEFIRDLPEALLTRELYQAFIATAKLSGPQQLSSLRCLVWLLPMPNRDTLQQLLSFLATVAEHSEDKVDCNGKAVCGNKMGVDNLAVIFGPNILHRYKKTGQSSNDTQYQVPSMERAEESIFVIKIVTEMIRRQEELFTIPRETHDEILRTLRETDPDAVDFLLRRKAANYTKSPTTRSSTERPEDGESTGARSLPAQNGHCIPCQSDVNNNNNSRVENSREKTADSAQSKKPDHAGGAGGGGTRAVYETSFSRLALSPPAAGSIFFTEQDVKEILRVDGATSPQKDRGSLTRGSSKAVNSRGKTVATVDESRRVPTAGELLPSWHRPQALQIQHQRRQAFSVQSESIQHRETEEKPRMHNASQSRVSTRGRRSPIVDSSPNSTSGFFDMSSASGETSSSYDPHENRPERARDPWLLKSADQRVRPPDGEANARADASPHAAARKQLPNALKVVRLNHAHGNHSAAPLHSLRISKNLSGRMPETSADNEIRTRQVAHRTSKDDTHFTLQKNRRRQEDIMI